FRFLLDTLDGIRLLRQIDASIFLKFVNYPVHDAGIPIVTAEVGVAVGCFYFEDTVANFQNGNVKGAAAQVVDRNLFVLLLVQAVGQGSSGRLINDAQDFQARDFSRVLGRVALRIVEVGRNGNDSLGDFLAQFRFRVALQFRQNHRGNFRR